MQYLKVIFLVCVMSCYGSGCALFVSESEEPPFYYEDRRLDRETPTPVLISDDRAFYLC